MQASSQGIHSGSVVRSMWFSPLFFFLCHQIYALFYVNNYCPVGKSVKKITSNGKRSRKPFKWGKWFSYSKWSDIGNDQIQWKEFPTAALRREQQHVHETPIRRDIKEDERESENEWACESVGVRTVVGSVRKGRIEMKYNVDGKKESTIHNWKKARHGVMLCRQTFILLRQKPFTALFFLPHSIFVELFSMRFFFFVRFRQLPSKLVVFRYFYYHCLLCYHQTVCQPLYTSPPPELTSLSHKK